ncbi:TPA: DnaA/Hda family protein [Streptococcus suis]|uniref:Chromosomal replication initiator protein dnaA n=1 Tax=Streptococcus suis TaxID=1307 RepID=A0A0Z8EN88_STRSU|nr:DnaA/Hda family protein [Streptococcus suis]WNF86554.1 DnaA/Hda family protein [Streptococcus parasuis]MBL6514551.1 chromosomal replication initiator DnaA [Streptococcus suis]NQH14748.1 chromosomal replication initiator DnaA [Streptococcus suis]NQH22667.1 chromosomal replication initiator DnaA [Streptococcus suis]NQK68593.1 chromosomal replication initiator DnaA [Streptococcus suis]
MKSINKNQTFENFSVNDGNAWALTALKTVIKDKNYYNPVYIYGEEGVGKSHLLNATNNALLSEQNQVILLSAENLTNHLVENLTYSEFDYILIDDLNLMPKDIILEEQLAMLIEKNKKQLIISSTVTPKDLEVSSKLQERLQWGLTTSMTP